MCMCVGVQVCPTMHALSGEYPHLVEKSSKVGYVRLHDFNFLPVQSYWHQIARNEKVPRKGGHPCSCKAKKKVVREKALGRKYHRIISGGFVLTFSDCSFSEDLFHDHLNIGSRCFCRLILNSWRNSGSLLGVSIGLLHC